MSSKLPSGFTQVEYLADERLVLVGAHPTWWEPPTKKSVKIVEVERETLLVLQKRATRIIEDRHGHTVISRQTKEVELETQRTIVVPKGSQLKVLVDRRYIVNDVQDRATGELFQLNVSTDGTPSLRAYRPSSGFNDDDLGENPFVS